MQKQNTSYFQKREKNQFKVFTVFFINLFFYIKNRKFFCYNTPLILMNFCFPISLAHMWLICCFCPDIFKIWNTEKKQNVFFCDYRIASDFDEQFTVYRVHYAYKDSIAN